RGDPVAGEGGIVTLQLAFILALLKAVMLITVFVRRMVKQRCFARRDNLRLHWAQVLDTHMKSQNVPQERPPLTSRIEMGAAEAVLLERWSSADAATRTFLYGLFRHWGLLAFRLRQLRSGSSW